MATACCSPAERWGASPLGWSPRAWYAASGRGPAIFLSNLLPAVGYLVLAVSSHPLVTGSAFALGSFAATIGNVAAVTLAIMAVALAPMLTTTALNAASGAHDDVRPRHRAGSDMGRRTT